MSKKYIIIIKYSDNSKLILWKKALQCRLQTRFFVCVKEQSIAGRNDRLKMVLEGNGACDEMDQVIVHGRRDL